MARSKTKKPEKLREIPLDWYIPDNVPTSRVTNAVVQMMGDEIVLSFFEQRGPLIITPADREKAMQLESAKALCVARISITPERLESFTKIFIRQLEQYSQAKEKEIKNVDDST